MKSLKEYIDEGLLDRVKNKEVNHNAIVKEFLDENYEIYGSYTIKTTNKGFVVDVKGDVEVANKNITALTNGLFEFGVVDESFKCNNCGSLTSLEGAPKEVGENFFCNGCKSLKSLEGAPKEVGRTFGCSYCDSLRTLKGAPKEVKWNFNCSCCKSLKTLEGAPKEVGGYFSCIGCKSLKSLEGAPKEVKWDFLCNDCGTQFTEEDVKKYTKLVKKIYI